MIDFAQSKLEQFEAQLQKIENVDESYSAEKLRGLLREANEVIRDDLAADTIVRKHSRRRCTLVFRQ